MIMFKLRKTTMVKITEDIRLLDNTFYSISKDDEVQVTCLEWSQDFINRVKHDSKATLETFSSTKKASLCDKEYNYGNPPAITNYISIEEMIAKSRCIRSNFNFKDDYFLVVKHNDKLEVVRFDDVNKERDEREYNMFIEKTKAYPQIKSLQIGDNVKEFGKITTVLWNGVLTAPYTIIKKWEVLYG